MQRPDAEKVHNALAWIVDVLNRHNLPYQVMGGLAAQAYGAARPLVDIDLYAPLDKAAAMLEELRPYVTRELSPYKSASWDVLFMALEYQGQWIEIGDSSTPCYIFSRLDQRWVPLVIDFARSNRMQLYGVEVDVMPKEQLLSYKAMLDREVDHLDIADILR